jgi:hypothetical protein
MEMKIKKNFFLSVKHSSLLCRCENDGPNFLMTLWPDHTFFHRPKKPILIDFIETKKAATIEKFEMKVVRIEICSNLQ